MTNTESTAWEALEPGHLVAIGQGEFENFCFDLVAFEAYDRHDGPPELDGPAGSAVADGGRDILLTVHRPPLVSKSGYQQRHHLHPLTEDPIVGAARSRTAYSCKSGPRWLNDALDDAKKHAKRAVEVLREGGWFKLLINVPGKLDALVKRNGREATPREHLAEAFWERLKKEQPDAKNPINQIEILDTNALAYFLRARRPEAGALDKWLARLALRPVLKSIEEWRRIHVEERQEPPFAGDALRTALHQSIGEFIDRRSDDPKQRVAWLIGPPGVGKTRLLMETLLSQPRHSQRVRVALSPEEAVRAIEVDRLFQRHGEPILVVDDCLAAEVNGLAARFRAAASAFVSAKLIMLTPAHGQSVQVSAIPYSWRLTPLEDRGARAIVAAETGGDRNDSAVVAMATFSEGFPWFARLIAMEFRDRGRAPSNMGEAVMWALASKREAAGPKELQDLQIVRARALLAVTLTGSRDWDQLEAEQQASIARAVGLESWLRLKDAAIECERRGLLRRNIGWRFKYVTPQILEREIVALLLGPQGPDSGGHELARHGAAFLETFFVALARLGLDRSIVSGLAERTLIEMREVALDWAVLCERGFLGARLMFAARHLPRETARELCRRIEATSVAELLKLSQVRRGVMFALEELVTRKGAFDDSEAALFRLAQAENESYGNNATQTWASLFATGHNTTHQSLTQRLELLARRVENGDAAARRVALLGVNALLTTHGFRFETQARDGEWPQPVAEEVSRAWRSAWMILAGAFADPEIGAVARKLAVSKLRSSVLRGFDDVACRVIADHADSFLPSERVALRRVLEEIEVYDSDEISAENPHLQRLHGAVGAHSFSERLRQRVGTWSPAGARDDDDTLDDSMAREGLEPDMAILPELEWLLSDEAERMHVFAFALGRVDQDKVLLPYLRSCASNAGAKLAAHVLLARYIGGHAQAGRVAAATSIVADMCAEDALASSVALAMVEVPGRREHVAWLVSAIRRARLDAYVVRELGRRREWLAGVGGDVVASLVEALVDAEPVVASSAALEIAVDHIEKNPSGAGALRSALFRVLERLAPEKIQGMSDYYWSLGAKHLVACGEAERVAKLALTVLSREGGSDDHAWKTIDLIAARDPVFVWRAVRDAVTRMDSGVGRMLVAFRFHRVAYAWPEDEVVEWIGADTSRATAVVNIVRPYAQELDKILRYIIKQFGPHSTVAGEIVSRLLSSDGVVSSLAAQDVIHLAHAQAWATDEDADIRAFSERAVASLSRSLEFDAAYEEHERRKWGT